jgi:MFS superfamily sulfate permease-like transporter
LALYAQKLNGRIIDTHLNKELCAQGLGNLVAGLFGAIPLTAVIVRSAANVQFGATSRSSTMLHGAWILVAVIAFGPILRLIPLPALAAVLIVTGIKLVNVKVFKDHLKHEIGAGLAYLTTFSMILATNLLRGLICGLVFAGAHYLFKRSTQAHPFSRD